MPPLQLTILQGAFFPVPPIRGGAVEKLWHQLGREFARQGHRVTHISRAVPELPLREQIDGTNHIRVAGYDQPASGLLLKWRDWRYTRRALRAAPPADILITNTFFAPLLATRRQGQVYVSVERMPKGQMRLYRRAARLRACSRVIGDAIIREAPALSARVVVIPNPLSFVPHLPAETRRHASQILYVGRIHPCKGVELLLQAFCAGKTRGTIARDCNLKLIGPAEVGRGGGGETWWRNLLRQYERTDIAWIGAVYDPDKLNAHYRESAVFAYPTLDESGEAMPVAPLEAMAWGCVPVVSALACFHDYIEPGRTGHVFDHRSPDRVNTLANTLGHAVSPTGLALSAMAAQVRTSHAVSTIAGRFIEDFATILRR